MATKTYETHLYQIVYPNQGLVASHLSAVDFARHYLIGSVRHYNGKLVFAEIDPKFRHPFFDIDGAWTTFRQRRLKVLVAHVDDEPAAAAPGVLDGTRVATAEGWLVLDHVQPEGKGPQDASAWRNGARPAPGERLGV